MKLLLARHGHAVDKSENPERPLSEQGRTEIGRMASFLGRAQVRVGRVLHSDKARAAQTAMMYTDVIGSGVLVEQVSGLAPNDDPAAIAEAVTQSQTDTLIAGHLPHLGRLASLLAADRSDMSLVDMSTGSVICLERGNNGDGWMISWMLDPRLLG